MAKSITLKTGVRKTSVKRDSITIAVKIVASHKAIDTHNSSKTIKIAKPTLKLTTNKTSKPTSKLLIKTQKLPVAKSKVNNTSANSGNNILKVTTPMVRMPKVNTEKKLTTTKTVSKPKTVTRAIKAGAKTK